MRRDILLLSLAVGFVLQRANARLSLAESCTGGLVSSWLTGIAGSSHWFDGGVVSYANGLKHHLLGVSAETLEQYGAVSAQTAAEMALGAQGQHRGALKSLDAHQDALLVSASITGIAGPGGGSPGKPVGTVFFGWAGPWGLDTGHQVFPGDRSQIRHLAAVFLLSGLFARLSG
jgi:nicotinamide-nucleotide amidase